MSDDPQRGGARVALFLVLVIALGAMAYAGVVPIPETWLGQDEVAGPESTGAVEFEASSRLAKAGDGSCHVVCELEYRRRGTSDDESVEGLRPELQHVAIKILRRQPRARLARGGGLAEFERQLLLSASELLRGHAIGVVGVRVTGMRFGD